MLFFSIEPVLFHCEIVIIYQFSVRIIYQYKYLHFATLILTVLIQYHISLSKTNLHHTFPKVIR